MSADEQERPIHPWATDLTEEFFHADTEKQPGEDNMQIAGFDIQPHVFFISTVLLIGFIVYSIVFPDDAGSRFGWLFNNINENFGWFYIIAANVFIVAVLFFAVGKYGSIRLGGVDAEKEFSDTSWVAMLFSAGMGIGLMFWSVAEPVWHYMDPLFGVEGNSVAGAEVAMAVTYFHWGFHPWAIYGIVGLALAFFAYNRGLPLTFRSVFWPILGERIYGWWGHLVDILAIFATLFGLATSLGLGAMQVNAGLEVVGEEILDISVATGSVPQAIIILAITALAVVSVALGIHKGIRVLSNVNVGLMLLLMFSVLILGPTLFLLEFVPQSTGYYLQNLPELSLWTQATGAEGQMGVYDGFQGFWTVFYWGWWIAWSPFVGMFIARISRGRTVREFVLGVLVLPVTFSFLFIGILGGTGMHFEEFTGETIITDRMLADEAYAMFEMFHLMELTMALSIVAIVLVVTFFVTSSDSGSLVLGHLSSGGKHSAPRNQRIGWAIIEGAVAASLIFAGGEEALEALRTASITAGLPFAVVLLFMCWAVWRGFQEEYRTLQSDEFALRLQELEETEDIVIKRTGEGVVTEVRDAEN